MVIFKWLAGILGGLLLGLMGVFMTTISSGLGDPGWLAVRMGVVFIALWLAAVIVAVLAPSIGKAWRRVLLSIAVASFALPLASLFATGRQVATVTQAGGAHVDASIVGTMLGGGIAAGFMGIIGLFMGVIFLLVGLMVGRDSRVIYVQAPQPGPSGR
jgi:hypothetical protein